MTSRGAVVLELAARNVSQRLRDYLPAHSAALLAVETEAARALREAVAQAPSALEAFRASRRHLRAVHLVAARLGARQVATEFAALGLDPPPRVTAPVVFLNQVAADLRRAIFLPGLTVDQRAAKAALAAGSVANRAYSEAQKAAYEAAQRNNSNVVLQKVWVTSASDGRICRYCLRLNGRAVGLAEEFPAPSGLKVYQNLDVPPAHPRCRCRVVVKVTRR